MMMKQGKKGFTLVEVLIVVVIIAALAAMIMPRVSSQADYAQSAEAINMLGALRRAVLSYYDEYQAWPYAGTPTSPSIQEVLGISANGKYWNFEVNHEWIKAMAKAQGSVNEITLNAGTGNWCGGGDFGTGGKFCERLTPRDAACLCED